jgi:quercetin dioxygenase-like cupin family protein
MLLKERLSGGRVRSVVARLAAAVLILAVCITAAGLASPKDEGPAAVPRIDAKALATLVQSFDKVEEQKHPWGWIRWLMNDKLDPKSEMTLGIVQVNANQRNPMHVHPNCEELLYVLSGSCEHVIGGQTVTLDAGDVIRIPAMVPHKAITGGKPMKAVIAYSSGDRQFEVVEE